VGGVGRSGKGEKRTKGGGVGKHAGGEGGKPRDGQGKFVPLGRGRPQNPRTVTRHEQKAVRKVTNHSAETGNRGRKAGQKKSQNNLMAEKIRPGGNEGKKKKGSR